MLPEEQYYRELLLSIYPCKVPFTVSVRKDKPPRRMGTYCSGSKRIIIHTGWDGTHSCVGTAIHEYAHHIHWTEFQKERRTEGPHGKGFWQVYGQLLCRARALGIYEDDSLPVLTFPGVRGAPARQKAAPPAWPARPEAKARGTLSRGIREAFMRLLRGIRRRP